MSLNFEDFDLLGMFELNSNSNIEPYVTPHYIIIVCIKIMTLICKIKNYTTSHQSLFYKFCQNYPIWNINFRDKTVKYCFLQIKLTAKKEFNII